VCLTGNDLADAVAVGRLGVGQLDRRRRRALPPVLPATLTAAPLVRRRDSSWALLGFRNLEPDPPARLEIVDPIPVALRDGELVDLR
jgi:hypothetical protein